ncbi:DUF2852 domain-containing protein [Albimonas sp. CAU 1670]|uniref:DUF2852 domain-containing protein n=1 Tax=Albimonas sp. CAU 1670 TaxID=3032599 RepID=UPI0023DCE23F|nr:DUF2852 domain-containing protein [Albimonas sp. CAU 1670]MDF2232764.1 DUF2852 domain-containing protein [Albimonas sp. CAU 1670]
MDRIKDLLKRAEATLDHWGKPGWIGAMVFLFIVGAWPLGLAMLFYMIWSGRMGKGCNSRWKRSARGVYRSSGNTAFDSYKEETLRRLEEEQEAFQSFLDRLRKAKDQAEFDQFMDERRKPAPDVATA